MQKLRHAEESAMMKKFQAAISRQNGNGEEEKEENHEDIPAWTPPQGNSHLSPEKRVQISKTLSWILRHSAKELGLEMSSDGFVALTQVLKTEGMKLLGVKLLDIQFVVRDCEKQRFALRRVDNKWEIRANQGHSKAMGDVVRADELLTPMEWKNVSDKSKWSKVCHGTDVNRIPSILATGLQAMKRMHIHFATTDELYGSEVAKGVSGLRQMSNALVYVDVKKCLRDGIPFFVSQNGVVLSPGKNGVITKEYFTKIVEFTHGTAGKQLWVKEQEEEEEEAATD
jgi:RNA:NAD 2'-phosphotransferase (TPT1/KptA family)